MASGKVLDFTDPLPYQTAFQAAELELVPTLRGNFRANLIQIRLDRIWMQRGNESLPRVLVGTVSPERVVVGFLTDARQPPVRHCGMEVLVNDLIVNDSKPMHRRTDAACRWGSISLASDQLAAITMALCGHALELPTRTHLVRPNSVLVARLLYLHEKLSELVEASIESLTVTEALRAIENEIIYVMVRCLDESTSPPPTHAAKNHAKIIRRLEEFLAENIFQPLYLEEICAVTEASERTLRACCQEYLGVSPVRYLWLRRMHLVRRVLALATSEVATVTQTAMDHGFWELGRFSVQYRALFGESPSVTLRRPPVGNLVH